MVLLSTLEEMPQKAAPSGHIYAALMQHYDLQDYQEVVSGLCAAKLLIQEDSYMLRLTDTGKELGAKINQLLLASKGVS